MRRISAMTLAALALQLPPGEALPQITGGEDASPAPFQVQLRFTGTLSTHDAAGNPITRPEWSRRHLCGGTVIASRWVLTAGHCLFDKRDGAAPRRRADSEIVVRADLSDIETPGEAMLERRVRSVLHPDYRHSVDRTRLVPPGLDNFPARFDFALLELNAPLPIAPLPRLAQEQVQTRHAVRVTGWGQLVDDDPMKAAQLQQADLKLVTVTRCNRSYRRPGGPRIIPTTGVLCAEGINDEGEPIDICKGDSGGPLTLVTGGKRRLAGVVSWASCGEPGKPSVHGDVRAVRAWIEATLAAPPAPFP